MPVPELKMFSICSNMKWNHLPNAGGLYDQDPQLLEAFRYIFSEISAHEAREAQKREREQKNRNPGGSRSPGRRRR